MREISAAEASRNFSAVLDAAERGDTLIVTRNGRRVATIAPAGAASGDAFVQVLREWQGRGAGSRDLERAIEETRALVSGEDDVDPWAG